MERILVCESLQKRKRLLGESHTIIMYENGDSHKIMKLHKQKQNKI